MPWPAPSRVGAQTADLCTLSIPPSAQPFTLYRGFTRRRCCWIQHNFVTHDNQPIRRSIDGTEHGPCWHAMPGFVAQYSRRFNVNHMSAGLFKTANCWHHHLWQPTSTICPCAGERVSLLELTGAYGAFAKRVFASPHGDPRSHRPAGQPLYQAPAMPQCASWMHASPG